MKISAIESRLVLSLTSRKVFHGTSASRGREIDTEGMLKPKKPGNWATGMFGGNPSNPDLVYFSFGRDVALDYMKQVCKRARDDQGALVTAKMVMQDLVPDEDVIWELISEYAYGSKSRLNLAIWDVWQKNDGVDLDYFEDWISDVSDSEVSRQMVELAEILPVKLDKKLLGELWSIVSTGGTQRPLKVEKVEYFRC